LSDTGKNRELNALIRLLDEPSDQIFDQIRNKLLFYGTDAIPSLEHAWDNAFDSQIQVRIEEIIHSIQLKDLHHELYTWKNAQRYDLFKGFYLVARYQYPELDETFVSERLEIIKRDIWLELNNNLTALEKVKVINHIIFDIHGFSGNKVNIDAPQNLFINNMLESHKGNHLSMGILYMIIAQKLGIPIFGVNLPQHFVLAYVDEIHDEKYSLADEDEVLFYINPFNKGAVFTRREIEIFIKHLKLNKDSGYFKPCDNIVIINRVLENLRTSFNKQGYGEKVDEVTSLIQVLQNP